MMKKEKSRHIDPIRPSFGEVTAYSVKETSISMQNFKDFKFVETNHELKVIDQNGGEILIVDKDVIGS